MSTCQTCLKGLGISQSMKIWGSSNIFIQLMNVMNTENLKTVAIVLPFWTISSIKSFVFFIFTTF